MQSKAATVDDYLASLPDDRRAALTAIRNTILANLDGDYEEGMQYGMIGYYVPHRVFPAGYHCDPRQPLPYIALASQKNHLALYMSGLCCGSADQGSDETADTRWFREAWTATGRKLDMGRACVRFKRLDDVPLDVVGAAVRRIPAALYIERYQKVLANTGKQARKPAAKTTPAKKKA